MWLAVLFAAIFGPDIVNTGAGGDSSTVPSAVAVALLAFLGTWVVAWRGFRRDRKELWALGTPRSAPRMPSR
jgi:hypothetical protein